MAETNKDPNQNVDNPTLVFAKQVVRWKKMDDVMAGEDRMRAAGQVYLPRKGEEEQKFYDERLEGSWWYPFTERVWNVMSGKPFVRPVLVQGKVDAKIEMFLENVNLIGDGIHSFSRELFRTVLKYGLAFILVDCQKLKLETLRNLRLDQEQNVRPYWVLIDPNNVIGFKTIVINGVLELQQVRIREKAFVPNPDDVWQDMEIDRIRVFDLVSISGEVRNPDTGEMQSQVVDYEVQFRVFEERQGGGDDSKMSWVQMDSGKLLLPNGQGMNRIPLVPVYGEKVGFCQGTPPLYKVAQLNIAHWQMWSEQNICERFIRVPLRVATGVQSDDFVLGANRIAFIPAETKMEIIQGSEKAGEFGMKSLQALEHRMAMASMELYLRDRPGNVTATEKSIQSAKEDSQLGEIVRNVEQGLDLALIFTGRWMAIEPDKTGQVSIHSDFSSTPKQVENVSPLDMWQKGALSLRTFLGMTQRWDLLGDDVDIEDEIKAIAAEQEAKAPFEPEPLPEDGEEEGEEDGEEEGEEES